MQDLTTAFTLTLDQAIDGWTLHLKARNLSPMTVKAYRAAGTGLDRFLRRSGMTSDIDQITSVYIEAYLADEVATKAAATAHQRYRGLKQLFAWLTSQGDIARDPMHGLRPPLIPERHIDTVDIDDFRKMLKTCARDHLIDVRDEALLRTLWDTGGRLAEVTGLKVADVDFGGQVVRLFGKGRRERHVAIAASTGSAIHRYLRRRAKTSQRDSSWLWTRQKGPMTSSGVRQMVWRRSKLAGLEHRVHPHQLRHSKADAWIAAGGTERGLMKQMGWKSSSMVMRYAANVAERRSIEEAKRLGLGDRLLNVWCRQHAQLLGLVRLHGGDWPEFASRSPRWHKRNSIELRHGDTGHRRTPTPTARAGRSGRSRCSYEMATSASCGTQTSASAEPPRSITSSSSRPAARTISPTCAPCAGVAMPAVQANLRGSRRPSDLRPLAPDASDRGAVCNYWHAILPGFLRRLRAMPIPLACEATFDLRRPDE